MGPKEKKISGTNVEGKAAGKRQLERRIHALTARVTYLESSLTESDQRTGELASELTKLAPASSTLGVLKANVAAARAELNGMAQRLDEMKAGQEVDAALEGIEGKIGALGGRLAQIEPPLSVLGGNLERYRQEQSALATTINELKEHEDQTEQHLGDAAERTKDLTERQAQLDNALSTTQDRLQKLEAALTTIGTTLESAERENTAREERVSGLLSEIEGLRKSETQREQQVQDSSNLIEREGERSKRLENALQAAQQRLQGLETALDQTGTALDSMREEKVAELESAIEGLRESDRQREQQLEGVSAWDEQLEKGLKAAEERLHDLESAQNVAGSTLDSLLEENGTREQEVAGLESAIAALRKSDREREQQLRDTAERIETAGQREDQLENALGASGDRLHHVETALDTAASTLGSVLEEHNATGQKVAGMESAIESLRKSDRRRELQFHDTTEQIERAGEREKLLEKALGTSGDRLNNVETTLDASGSTLNAISEENRARDEKITGVQSWLRTLTWAGTAALVALTAGVLMYVSKQQTQREVMENELNLVEQRLSGVGEHDGSQTQILAQEVADLQGQVRTLNARLEAPPQDDMRDDSEQIARFSEEITDLNTALTDLSGRIDGLQQDGSTIPEAELIARMDTYVQEQAGIVENLDDLGARLARIEGQIAASKDASVPKNEPLIPPVGEQKSEEKQELWKTASGQRHFTLQLLGVRNRPSLIEFAQRHRLLADSAEFETEYEGAPWFVLFHGIYESRSQAAKAARELAPSLPGTKLWVRRLPRAGNIETLEKSL